MDSNNKKKRLARERDRELRGSPAWEIARAANYGKHASTSVFPISDLKVTDTNEAVFTLDGREYLVRIELKKP